MVTDTFCLFYDSPNRQPCRNVNKEINKIGGLYLLSFVRQVRRLSHPQKALGRHQNAIMFTGVTRRNTGRSVRVFLRPAPNFFVTEAWRRPLFFL
jgi:hypothetical protein